MYKPPFLQKSKRKNSEVQEMDFTILFGFFTTVLY